MTKEQVFLIDCLVGRMSLKLSSDKGISVVEAMNIVYNSNQYELILDLETGLYYQSADYNYLNLLEELRNNLQLTV